MTLDNDNPNSWSIIILHPDFEKLKMDVDKLRIELSMLVLERDNLLYHECKNIETAYMLSIGTLEYKVYEIECGIYRLKRKMELIQARKNRQEKIIISAIDDILDFEFAEYQEKLSERLGKVNAALERSRSKSLTKEETRELKKLYRSIVKELHPDLHPDIDYEKIKLFHNAVKAYEQGDLNGLKIIEAIIAEPVILTESPDGLSVLIKEKDRLANLLQDVKDRIVEIKSEYPYTMKALIQNREKTELRKTELEEQIKQLNEIFSAYTERINEMLG